MKVRPEVTPPRQKPPCFSHVNDAVLVLITRNLHMKSSKVAIKTRSTPASLTFKGQATIVPLVENSTFYFCINDTRNCMIVHLKMPLSAVYMSFICSRSEPVFQSSSRGQWALLNPSTNGSGCKRNEQIRERMNFIYLARSAGKFHTFKSQCIVEKEILTRMA